VFADPTIVRVHAYYNVSKAAPAHVLQKAGFTCEAVLRGYLQMANLGRSRDVFLSAKSGHNRPRLLKNYRGLRSVAVVGGDA